MAHFPFLRQVQEEKEEAQKKLDEEQEYVVNKLRRELSAVVAEKQYVWFCWKRRQLGIRKFLKWDMFVQTT